MVRAASSTAFLLANPVASTRLGALLVRNARANPVRKSRRATGGYKAVAPPKRFGSREANRKTPRDAITTSCETIREYARGIPQNRPRYKHRAPQNHPGRKRVCDLQVELKPRDVPPSNLQLAIEMAAAESQDRVCSSNGPEHS